MLFVTGDCIKKIERDEGIEIITEQGKTQIKYRHQNQEQSIIVDFYGEFVETPDLTLLLSGRIEAGSPARTGTCELIVKTDSGKFAATSMHMVMTDEEVRNIPSDNIDPFLHSIAERFQPARLIAARHQQTPLIAGELSQALCAYRVYATNEDDKESKFMNDIAVLQLDHNLVTRLMDMPQMTEHCAFNAIVPISEQSLYKIHQGRPFEVLASSNRKGVVVEPPRTPNGIGHHISFILSEG